MKISRYLIYALLVFALAACAPAATPTAESIQSPVPTDTPVSPTETMAPPPTPTLTVEPSPTADPLLFRDGFDGSLAEGWKWTNENKKTWNLNTPGFLEILTSRGYMGGGNLENVLLRPIPEGNFELELKLNFKPTGDYQLAGLLIYESAFSFIQFGRAFCDAAVHCKNDGFYVDLIVDGNNDGENFATAAVETENTLLRLRREGFKYTAYASQDGENWQVIGEKTSEMKPLFVGLIAGQAQSAPKPAQFDYFMINQLP